MFRINLLEKFVLCTFKQNIGHTNEHKMFHAFACLEALIHTQLNIVYPKGLKSRTFVNWKVKPKKTIWSMWSTTQMQNRMNECEKTSFTQIVSLSTSNKMEYIKSSKVTEKGWKNRKKKYMRHASRTQMRNRPVEHKISL